MQIIMTLTQRPLGFISLEFFYIEIRGCMNFLLLILLPENAQIPEFV